jgi:hypothetical protein
VPSGRTFRIALAAVAVTAAAAAAILLNLALLGYAQPRNDPVGKLSPRAALLPAPAALPTPAPQRPADAARGERDD